MRAFENGADGVLVAGCEEGSCHFIEGNLMAKRRVNYTREILSEAGFEKERLRMVNIGAANARRFVEIIKDMIETVRKLGPNPGETGPDSKINETGDPSMIVAERKSIPELVEILQGSQKNSGAGMRYMRYRLSCRRRTGSEHHFFSIANCFKS